MMLFNSLALLAVNLSVAIRYNGADIYTLLKYENLNIRLPVLDEIIKNLENGYSVSDSWSLAVEKTAHAYRLNNNDKAVIIQFGSKLGTTDVNGQTEHCSYYKNIFQSKAKLFENDYITKAKLYKTLGLFSGMAIVLVIM